MMEVFEHFRISLVTIIINFFTWMYELENHTVYRIA